MALQWNYIQKQKPVLFDWLVFTLSMLMGLIFPNLGSLLHSPAFSAIILVALVLYTAGCWLKHAPLHERLARQGRAVSLSYTFFLVVGHWVIMLMALLIAEGVFRQIFRLPARAADAPASGWLIFTVIIVSVLLTWLVFRPGRGAKAAGKNQPQRELWGDLLLLSAVTLFSYVFWESSLLAAIGHMEMSGFGSILLQFCFLSFAYLLFYLPLRYLYLLEDNAGGAWKRLLLIFLLLLLRGVLLTVAR